MIHMESAHVRCDQECRAQQKLRHYTRQLINQTSERNIVTKVYASLQARAICPQKGIRRISSCVKIMPWPIALHFEVHGAMHSRGPSYTYVPMLMGTPVLSWIWIRYSLVSLSKTLSLTLLGVIHVVCHFLSKSILMLCISL